MAHSYYHAKSSERKFGVPCEDALPIHNWFDGTKSIRADFRHRALRHHKQGVVLASKIFKNWNFDVSIEKIGEQHMKEDFLIYPDAKQWYESFEVEPWMIKRVDNEKVAMLISKKFGGQTSDYLFLVDFFTQFDTEDPRSRMILHHSWGIFDAESVFGYTFTRQSDNKEMPTRTLAESVMLFIWNKIFEPSDWLDGIRNESWMMNNAKALSKEYV